MAQWRNCVFTLNNYTTNDVETIKLWECKYLVFGFEVGEKGTPHLQGYVEWNSSTRLTTLKKKNAKIHWEERKGTAEQAATYCKKDNNFFEKGTISKQGARSDIKDVVAEVMAGKRVDEICLERPEFYHQYGRTLTKVEDLMLRQKFRTAMTTCDWIYGSTGIGKSHAAFKNFHPDTHYVWKDDGGWQDGYTQQETVIINDFRGTIPYNELLQMIDKWPYSLRRRNREPMPFTSKHIIITSSLKPEEVYKQRHQKDDIAQLLRRVNVINLEVRQKWSGVILALTFAAKLTSEYYTQLARAPVVNDSLSDEVMDTLRILRERKKFTSRSSKRRS